MTFLLPFPNCWCGGEVGWIPQRISTNGQGEFSLICTSQCRPLVFHFCCFLHVPVPLEKTGEVFWGCNEGGRREDYALLTKLLLSVDIFLRIQAKVCLVFLWVFKRPFFQSGYCLLRKKAARDHCASIRLQVRNQSPQNICAEFQCYLFLVF